MSSPILTIEIPNYIRQVKTSNSRNAKYYEKSKKKLPKKYEDTTKYDYKEFGGTHKGQRIKKYFLVNLDTGHRVVANPQSVGTPKFYLINGQDLWRGTIRDFEKQRIAEQIKKSFITYLTGKIITQFPIRIFVDVYDLIYDPLNKGQLWDMDNRFLGWYVKTLQDTMKDCGCIPDDNVLYITGPPAPAFCPVETLEERKLVIKIYHDQRPIITSNKHYV